MLRIVIILAIALLVISPVISHAAPIGDTPEEQRSWEKSLLNMFS